jgi:hypothetical protein
MKIDRALVAVSACHRTAFSFVIIISESLS